MNDTGIIWTEATWNPMSGCVDVTPGCEYCYAKTLAENMRGGAAFPNGFELTIRPHKLREPLRLKEPTLIFVNSMSDMFWEAIGDDYRDQMVDVMEQTPQHEYQVLTKRPEQMLRYSKRRRLPHNMWAGVTIEAQRYLEPRIALLRQVEASIRFISAEPLLTPLDFTPSRDNILADPKGGSLLAGIDWLISGGESGVHLCDPKICKQRGLVYRNTGEVVGKKMTVWAPRPERIEWIQSLRDQCNAAGVKFFHKQWGGQYPHSAGRLLDGRTWDEFPRLPAAKTQSKNRYLFAEGGRA